MKIVLLDGAALNPGDLSWGALEALGALKVYDRTAPEQIVPRAQHADAILTHKTPLNRETIRHLAALKYIGILADGHQAVNVEAAHKKGVVVTHVPGVSTAAVAQHTLALILELAGQVGHHAHTVRQGRWSKHPDFSYWLHPLRELAGLTLGIIGYGRIGQAVADRAEAFAMRVLLHTPNPPAGLPPTRRAVGLEALLAESDVVSLHCPFGPLTGNLINRTTLAQVKKGACLINTSHGGLVDEEAVLEALRSGWLGGAALDVLATEPPDARNPLLRARGCLVTPHLGWATVAARHRMVEGAAANLAAYVAGQSRNVL